MSSDRRPAKVRVVSSDTDDGDVALAPAPGTPARRRGDKPQGGEQDALVEAAIASASPERQSGGFVWAVGAVMLFLIGCAVGGGLLMLSGLVSTADL